MLKLDPYPQLQHHPTLSSQTHPASNSATMSGENAGKGWKEAAEDDERTDNVAEKQQNLIVLSCFMSCSMTGRARML